MSTAVLEGAIKYEEGRGKPRPSENHGLEKVEAYLNSGVQTCWVVNPPLHTITLYSADGSQKTYVEGQAIDPATGLTANLEAVFS